MLEIVTKSCKVQRIYVLYLFDIKLGITNKIEPITGITRSNKTDAVRK